MQTDSSPTDQVLILFESIPPGKATWEKITDLAIKVDFGEGRMLPTQMKLNRHRTFYLLSPDS